MASTLLGWIWEVRGFAVHDGPGIRTAVFFKGCPLACAWCCNPETQQAGEELVFDRAQCLDCRWCVGICGHGAIPDASPDVRTIDRERCDRCGDCPDRCPSGALTIVGRQMSVEEVLRQVLRDNAFHQRSGGGITLTGGEPLWQPSFAAELVRRYKRDAFGASVTIETSGAVPWASFEAVLPHTDLFLFDVKHIDPVIHRRLTGSDNSMILENLGRLAACGAAIVLRLPLVPECNDDEEHLKAVGGLARTLGLRTLQLLPYHRMGERRYAGLGLSYPLTGLPPLRAERVNRARDLLVSQGLAVSIGG